MTKEMKIINELYYWKEKLKVPFFVLNFDNQTKASAYVIKNKSGIKLALNMKMIKEYSALDVISIIFHEFGHILYTLDKDYSELKAEVVAENYSLKTIKKYCSNKDYKDYFRKMQDSVNMNLWKKSSPIHQRAFEIIYK